MNMKSLRFRVLLSASTFLILYSVLPLTWNQNASVLSNVEWFGKSQSLAGNQIPRNIWRIFLKPSNADENFEIDPEKVSNAASWSAWNPDYVYHLVGDQSAYCILDSHEYSNQGI